MEKALPSPEDNHQRLHSHTCASPGKVPSAVSSQSLEWSNCSPGKASFFPMEQSLLLHPAGDWESHFFSSYQGTWNIFSFYLNILDFRITTTGGRKEGNSVKNSVVKIHGLCQGEVFWLLFLPTPPGNCQFTQSLGVKLVCYCFLCFGL